MIGRARASEAVQGVSHLRTVPASAERRQVEMKCDRNASGFQRILNAEGGTRTHTHLRGPDFESGASAISPLRPRRLWTTGLNRPVDEDTRTGRRVRPAPPTV